MHKFRRSLLAALLGGAALTSSATTPGSATYTYDDIGRLLSVVYEDGSGQFYSYDAAGNRTTSVSGPQVTFSISANASSVNEPASGTGTAVFTVTKSSGAQTTATVHYATVDGTAHAGVNYTATSGTLSFTAAQTSQTITVSTLHDSKYDGALNFSVSLSSPVDAVITTSGAAETLNEADPAPAFSIAAATAAEGSTVNLTVTRANATSLTQTVNYATANGTAVAGTDYTTTSGTLSFAPADTSHTISVPTTSRSNYEGTRSFATTLSGPSNGAVLGTASANGSITDVNTPISFAIANSSGTVAEGSPMTFTVTEGAGPAGIPFTVNYAINSGTAVYGTDMTASSPASQTGTLSFPVGTTSQSIVLNTFDVRQETGTRNFTVTLSNASNSAPIGTTSATGTIQETNVPGAPTLSPASQYNATSGTYSLSWTNPGGSPTSYQLWEISPVNQQVYSGTALSYGATLRTSPNPYDFQVKACNASGCGAFSNTAIVNICINGNC